jgi:hypothetical protein
MDLLTMLQQGFNITMGTGSFINSGATILDEAKG